MHTKILTIVDRGRCWGELNNQSGQQLRCLLVHYNFQFFPSRLRFARRYFQIWKFLRSATLLLSSCRGGAPRIISSWMVPLIYWNTNQTWAPVYQSGRLSCLWRKYQRSHQCECHALLQKWGPPAKYISKMSCIKNEERRRKETKQEGGWERKRRKEGDKKRKMRKEGGGDKPWWSLVQLL